MTLCGQTLPKSEDRGRFLMEKNPFLNSQYPPGIRFHPSDEELITYYLLRKVRCLALPAKIIADIEFYNFNPWDLPKKALLGEDEWYFFTPRDRKYPNGGRPNRTARSGYWKATGIDKPIFSANSGSSKNSQIGVKKDLVFYKGKPPKGNKTDWIMTEYRLPDTSRPLRSKGSMRLDDWVICRVRQKGNKSKKAIKDDEGSRENPEQTPKIEDQQPSMCLDDCRDMLADYLLSSECGEMALWLLNGHDPAAFETIPRTISHGQQEKKIKNAQASMTISELNEEKNAASLSAQMGARSNKDLDCLNVPLDNK